MFTPALIQAPVNPSSSKTTLNNSQNNDAVESASSDNSFSQTLSKEIAGRTEQAKRTNAQQDSQTSPSPSTVNAPETTQAVSAKRNLPANERSSEDLPFPFKVSDPCWAEDPTLIKPGDPVARPALNDSSEIDLLPDQSTQANKIFVAICNEFADDTIQSNTKNLSTLSPQLDPATMVLAGTAIKPLDQNDEASADSDDKKLVASDVPVDMLALVNSLTLPATQIQVTGKNIANDAATGNTKDSGTGLQLAVDPNVKAKNVALIPQGPATSTRIQELASDASAGTGLSIKLDQPQVSDSERTLQTDASGKKIAADSRMQNTDSATPARNFEFQMQDAAKMQASQDLTRLNRDASAFSTERKAVNETLLNSINPSSMQSSAQSLANTNAMLQMPGLQQMNERLTPRVGSANWDNALGQQVLWMASNGQQSASLTLNPPDLGPMQVVLSISNDQATASFVAAQPEVRQALEAALPRLREMMSDAGIQLGQTTVSANSQQQQAFNQNGSQGGRNTSGETRPGQNNAEIGVLPVSSGSATRSGRGIVDTFA